MAKGHPIFISLVTIVIHAIIKFGGTNFTELGCKSCKELEKPVIQPTPAPEIAEEIEPEPESKPAENQNEKSKPIRWARSFEGQLYLVEKELELYEIMKQYEIDLARKLNHVNHWLDDFEDSSLRGTRHLTNTFDKIDEISSHPLMALRMIRRYVNLNHDILVNDAPEKALQKLNNEIAETSRVPSITDYEDSMHNLIYSAFTYELDKSDIMNGKISNIQTKVGLTLEQGYDIVLYAEKKQAYSEAYFWLQAVKDVSEDRSHEDFQISEDQINADVERIAIKHDELLDRIEVHNPDSDEYWRKYQRFTSKMLPNINNIEKLQTFKEFQDNYDLFIYQNLCKGDNYQTEQVKSTLICFYESKSHPRWRINPLKIEVYSWEPYVIRYYDALPNKSIEYIKNVSRPMMEGATVINEEYNETDSSTGELHLHHDSRIATFSFLMQREPSVQYIEERIADMTGLVVNSLPIPNTGLMYASESIQVASYATGGLYEYHFDALPGPGDFWKEIEGNRIATFLVYLNDVELGGETAFPTAGIAVKPIKNTAVFWYNLKRNGETDERTLHGGCPVLIGRKQISNIWIRSAASFLKRKCLLDPNL